MKNFSLIILFCAIFFIVSIGDIEIKNNNTICIKDTHNIKKKADIHSVSLKNIHDIKLKDSTQIVHNKNSSISINMLNSVQRVNKSNISQIIDIKQSHSVISRILHNITLKTPLQSAIQAVTLAQAGETYLGYSYRLAITIDHTLVSGASNLIDFPLLFALTNNDLKHIDNGGKINDPNGYDIIFADANCENQLKHDVEAYDNTTGTIIAHIKIPILKYAEDTVIYILYGNAAITTDQSDPTNVWDNDYIGIYHFNNNVTDSTSLNNDGVDYGTDNAVGKISNCRSFSYEYIDIASIINDIDPAHGTISLWMTLDTASNNKNLFEFYADEYNKIYAKYIVNLEVLRIGRIVGVESSLAYVAPKYITQTLIYDLITHDSGLYVGTGTSGYLLKWNGVDAFELKAGTLNSQKIISLISFGGDIYGATLAGRLHKWNGVNAWTQVAGQLNSQSSYSKLIEHDGSLYLGTYNATTGCRLQKWNGVNAWVQVAVQFGSETSVKIIEYNGKIYGGTYPHGLLLEWNESDAWMQVAGQLNSQEQIECLLVHNDQLYGGTSTGGRLFKFNDLDAWIQVAGQTNLQTAILSLYEYKNEIYGGTSPDGYIFKLDLEDGTWNAISDTSGVSVHALESFENKLFGVTYTNGTLFAYDSGVEDRYEEVAGIVQSSTTFRKITLTWDDISDEIIVYVDGEIYGTVNTDISLMLGSIISAYLGRDYASAETAYRWQGDIDEIRISKKARSADWEKTEYNNQNNPSSFYSIG